MNKLKRLLLVLLLGPLFPIIGVAGEVNNEGSKDQGNKDEGSNDEGNNDSKDEGKTNPVKTFTQDDVNNFIEKRLARERKNWQKQVESDKAKADLTEVEKLKLEKEEANQKVTQAIETANKRLIRADIINKAGKLNVIDTDAVMAMIDMSDIEVDDEGNIKGVDDALKLLIEKKPYLIKGKVTDDDNNSGKAGDDQQQSNNKKTKVSFNDMLRKATGRM